MRSLPLSVLAWIFFSGPFVADSDCYSVHISPEDDGLDTDPIIDYRAFSNPVDLDLNIELLQGVRWFMSHEAMVEALQPQETSPRIYDDAGMRSWMRRTINPDVAHQVGTAALGPKELGGVVGPDLRVHGTSRLSVADNSIVPMVPGSHTSALAYAVGEKVGHSLCQRVIDGANTVIGCRFDSTPGLTYWR